MLSQLRRLPLFQVIEGEARDWLEASYSRSVPPGEVLSQEGAPAKSLFILESGRVRILRQGSDGREHTLGTAGAGELLGDYSLLPPHRSAPTLRVSEPSVVRFLSLKHLQGLIGNRVEILHHLRAWLRLNYLVRYLNDGPYLGFMSASSFLSLLDVCQSTTIPAMRTVQSDCLSTDTLFHIRSGGVLLPATDCEGEIHLGPGDTFGASCFVGVEPRTAIATTDVECNMLRYTDVFEGDAPILIQSFKVLSDPRPEEFVWIGQREETDCGIASLAMVMRHWGADVTVESLRRRIALRERGCSLLDLQSVAEELGWHSTAIRVCTSQLADVALPAVAHQSSGHFVVVFRCQGEQIIVGDPALGLLRVNRSDFQREWTGNLLSLRGRDSRIGSADVRIT